MGSDWLDDGSWLVPNGEISRKIRQGRHPVIDLASVDTAHLQEGEV